MVETLNFNWSEISNINVEQGNYTSANQHIIKPVLSKTTQKDTSAWINKKRCVTITAMYASMHNTTLHHDKTKNIYWFDDGVTICPKARCNVYNKRGNFTFTDADLEADLVAIYSYDGVTNKGTWYICDMTYVRPLTMKRDPKGFLICPEKPIISHAALSIEVNFRKK